MVRARKLGFAALALKHPLQTFILPYLDKVIEPKYIFVTRPLEQIEATRLRRKWHPVYGALGANIIYQTAMKFLISHSRNYLSIPYNSLVNDDTVRATLLEFCKLSPTDEMLSNA